MNVGAERLERRHVDHMRLVCQTAVETFAKQFVERDQKRGERLAGAGRRRNQRVPAGADRCPSRRLRSRRCSERGREPSLNRGMKSVERQANVILARH